MADVTMPQLGETVTEGTITKWFKQVGDQVAEDEVLFEVSTDKVDSEVPSPAAGYVTEIQVPEGDTVDVGAVLAVIADAPPGDGRPAPPARAAGRARSRTSRHPHRRPSRRRSPSRPQPPSRASRQPGTRSLHAAPRRDASRRRRRRRQGAVAGRAPADHRARPRPRQITGTGAGGRITRNDVLAVDRGEAREPHRAAHRPRRAGARAAPAAAGRAPHRALPRRCRRAPGERDTPVPLSNIRRRTAEHMIRSKQTSAHVYAAIEVDYEAVEQVRRAERDDVEGRRGLQPHVPAVHRRAPSSTRSASSPRSTRRSATTS